MTPNPVAWGIEFEASTTIETMPSQEAAEAFSRRFGSEGEEVDVVSRVEGGLWRYGGGRVSAGNDKPVLEHNHRWAWTNEFDGPLEKETCLCGEVQWV